MPETRHDVKRTNARSLSCAETVGEPLGIVDLFCGGTAMSAVPCNGSNLPPRSRNGSSATLLASRICETCFSRCSCSLRGEPQRVDLRIAQRHVAHHRIAHHVCERAGGTPLGGPNAGGAGGFAAAALRPN